MFVYLSTPALTHKSPANNVKAPSTHWGVEEQGQVEGRIKTFALDERQQIIKQNVISFVTLQLAN